MPAVSLDRDPHGASDVKKLCKQRALTTHVRSPPRRSVPWKMSSRRAACQGWPLDLMNHLETSLGRNGIDVSRQVDGLDPERVPTERKLSEGVRRGAALEGVPVQGALEVRVCLGRFELECRRPVVG